MHVIRILFNKKNYVCLTDCYLGYYSKLPPQYKSRMMCNVNIVYKCKLRDINLPKRTILSQVYLLLFIKVPCISGF